MNTYLLIHTLSADTDIIGRIDPSHLPKQVLMELLVQSFTTIDSLKNSQTREYLDIENWSGVTVFDGDVIWIEWKNQPDSFILSNPNLLLQYVPESVESLDVSFCDMVGTLEFGEAYSNGGTTKYLL